MNNTIIETINQTINQTTPNPQIFGFQVPFTGHLVLDIFFITILIALFTTLVNKYLTDQEKIKTLRKEMKDLQRKMKETMLKNPQKAKELQAEIMQKNMENMKHSMNFKVLLTTMLPLLIILGVVRKNYGLFGEFLNLGFTKFGWLGTYFWFSIINSIIMKKIFDVA